MAEWLLDEGIGEHRAALVEDETIIEAMIDRQDGRLRCGAVVEAVLGERVGAGAWLRTAAGDAVLEAVPAGVSQGRRLTVEIIREALPEPGRPKPPRARATDTAPRPAPSLRERLGGAPVRPVPPHGPDLLEGVGWSALLEEAESGEIAFPGGALRLWPTPAMTLIDVDGTLPPAELATAGARAAARAIRRHAIGGSIGIDLPTLMKADRAAPAAAIDAVLPQPFERTGVNGFGFLQIVRPRPRASLPELVRADPALAAALELLRRTARDTGGRRLVAAPPVIARLAAQPGWTDALARRIGGPTTLRAEPGLAISAAYAEPL